MKLFMFLVIIVIFVMFFMPEFAIVLVKLAVLCVS